MRRDDRSTTASVRRLLERRSGDLLRLLVSRRHNLNRRHAELGRVPVHDRSRSCRSGCRCTRCRISCCRSSCSRGRTVAEQRDQRDDECCKGQQTNDGQCGLHPTDVGQSRIDRTFYHRQPLFEVGNGCIVAGEPVIYLGEFLRHVFRVRLFGDLLVLPNVLRPRVAVNAVHVDLRHPRRRRLRGRNDPRSLRERAARVIVATSESRRNNEQRSNENNDKSDILDHNFFYRPSFGLFLFGH